MKLLLNERNLIVAIGSNIEYGVWGNVGDLLSWKINGNMYMMDENFTLVDIGDTKIPTYVEEGEHYYIDGEFIPKGKSSDNAYDEMAAAIREGVNEV